jgi:hypothetical protein
MGSAQVLAKDDTVPDAPPRYRSNVFPLRATRARLEVFLTGSSPDALRANLAALFHSALGVYVSRTEAARDKVRVHFNIAAEDLDFALHTLITTLPEAIIGTITRPGMQKDS